MADDFRSSSSYQTALEDFRSARRRAGLETVFSRLTGRSPDLIQYNEIRSGLRAIETQRRQLEDVPIRSIIGSVGRYGDFSRSFLPLRESDEDRWARVKAAQDDMIGLPPVELYKVGDAYFVLDGHHRVSISRNMGAEAIQAYVTIVQTLVPLSPDDQPEDIIIKEEQTEFLAETQLDNLRPNSDVRVTEIGQYKVLLEHISVHRYYMGIDQNREIAYPEAVAHWYDEVYMPVVRVIRERNLLRDFPDRTEADLYLWLMDHRVALQNEFGLNVRPEAAAADLTRRFARGPLRWFQRLSRRFLNWLMPDEIEPEPPTGSWREEHGLYTPTQQSSLFGSILVAVTGDPDSWGTLDAALKIAAREGSVVGGLHVLPPGSSVDSNEVQAISEQFKQRCEDLHVEGHLVIEAGQPARVIYKRAAWADLIALRAAFIPPLSPARLRSPMRNLIRRLPTPLLAVPPEANTNITHALLAYGGGLKALEALYMATYLAARWQVKLTVITVDSGSARGQDTLSLARKYLEHHQIQADFIQETGDRAKSIVETAGRVGADFIIMGGYEARLIVEILKGSTVDKVLSASHWPVLICR